MTKFKKYWAGSLVLTLALSFYPLYMGAKVVFAMLTQGYVQKEEYPKYIIPYTPIALAVIVSVAFMPLLVKLSGKRGAIFAALISSGVFLAAELIFEKSVLVMGKSLEDWQMYMCYIPPSAYKTRVWTPVDILMGDYSPTFKLHFYFISFILIITSVVCLYGFAQKTLGKSCFSTKALVIQAICTASFLGLCILACFTAFFRNGDLIVSPVSALLMSAFFVLFGVTSGMYVASFLQGKRKALSVFLPAAISSAMTFVMYICEMCLLSGHLYILGSGFIFQSLPCIVLSIADILLVLMSGAITAYIAQKISK